MGFAANMASNPQVRDYDLSHQTKYRVLPEPADESLIAEYKHNFRAWVISNALREVHESFVEYMEKVNEACLTFQWVAREKTPEECDRLQKKFHSAGFPDKLDILRRNFAVTTQHDCGLRSINSTRNCLTHRRGVVGTDDLNDGGKLTLQWRALEIYIIPAGGEPVLNRDIPPSGIPMRGGAIESKYVERQCSFSDGQLIELSTLQLAEICAFADEAAVELANTAVEFARGIGISIRDRPKEVGDG